MHYIISLDYALAQICYLYALYSLLGLSLAHITLLLYLLANLASLLIIFSFHYNLFTSVSLFLFI